MAAIAIVIAIAVVADVTFTLTITGASISVSWSATSSPCTRPVSGCSRYSIHSSTYIQTYMYRVESTPLSLTVDAT